MPVFSNITIEDIDKQDPQLEEASFENETWETLKTVKIKAKDNIRIHSWAVSKNQEKPLDEEWNVLENLTPELDVTADITENGIYYVFVRDSAGRTVIKQIQVDKVDNTPPEIDYTINKDTLDSGYVTITVVAVDNGSGLYDRPYSWDNITWSQENNVKTVTSNGRYKVYAVDMLGNINEKEILIDVFPQEGTVTIDEGDIIDSVNASTSWNQNMNDNVEIKLKNNLNLVGWQITQTTDTPADFIFVGIIERIENINTTNTLNINTTNSIDGSSNENTINTVNTNNSASDTMTIQQVKGNNDSIQINRALSTDTLYYLWIKDMDGNIRYQTFTIYKPEI